MRTALSHQSSFSSTLLFLSSSPHTPSSLHFLLPPQSPHLLTNLVSVLSTPHTPPSLPPLLTSHSIPYSPHLSHLHPIHAHFLPHPLIYHLHTLAFLTHLLPLLVPPPVPLISFLHTPRPFPYQPHVSLFPLISLLDLLTPSFFITISPSFYPPPSTPLFHLFYLPTHLLTPVLT